MRKGDETKREILRAAEQLFCQKGYEAASMQEIVRAAGVMPNWDLPTSRVI